MIQEVGTATNTARVLIVDDHPFLSEAVAGMLRTHDCDVTVASSFGVQELTATVLRLGRVVVLLDLHLRDVLSIPLIRPLTESGAIVILLTADSTPSLLGRSLLEGAVAVLSKETEYADIVFSIHQAWHGDRAMSRARREALLAAGRQADHEERLRLAPFESLTAREQVVLRHVLSGRSPKDIAKLESVSVLTVRAQLRTMFTKLDVGSQREAIVRAHEAGWG